MILYHVTNKEKGIQIWEQGLKSNSKINETRSRRRQMREHIDRLAFEKYSNYVSRKEAIFAWTTFDKAVSYAKMYQEPAIVEFDISGNAWCVESFIAEDLYETYHTDIDDMIMLNTIKHYKPWTGQRNDELEVWFQEKSIDGISRVVDNFGNPL